MQDVAFLFQLTDSPTQHGVVFLDRAERLTGGRRRTGRTRSAAPTPIIGPDPATQRLPVDTQVIGYQRDRRARPRPVQRHRIGLELLWVVLGHHRVPGLLSTRTI